MSNEVLKINNLVKKYDNSDRVILNNLDLTINDEDFLCILGPSGCGKSTLIRCIAGFEDYEGSIKVDGQPVVKPGPDRIMVFQDFNQLFPWKTVLKNITYALKVNGMKDKAEREQKAKKYLEKVNLVQYANYYPHQLSGGMKQRVAIAKGMALGSKIILMDEPFAALDAMTRKQLQSELLKLKQKDFYRTLLTMFTRQEIEKNGYFLRNRFEFGPFRADTGKIRIGLNLEKEFSELSHSEQRLKLSEYILFALNHVTDKLKKKKLDYDFDLMLEDFNSILTEWKA